ncbi:MAG: GDP-mannose 4,6-dehydratase [Castellaniella sp.]|nr:GDP-mannose 4,6-dehydratase [Castellaniella sp.]
MSKTASIPSHAPLTLVTGDAGFVGQHVLRTIANSVGLSALRPGLDIRDQAALAALLGELRPQRVIHLAARSFVPDAFRDPEATFEVNFIGTYRLLAALRQTGFTGRLLFVGSGDVYGPVDAHELPLRESRALCPTNPYAVSKVAAEALCLQWSRSAETGFEILMARPFNHIGAEQPASFVVADFARQIARIRHGLQPPLLSVGNIEVSRDFTDVVDVVRAYELLLERGASGEVYNVCSGRERTIRALVERLLAIAGLDAHIEVDPARYRPADQPRVYGDYRKLQAATGWQPQIPFEQTLQTIYTYWEQQIGK